MWQAAHPEYHRVEQQSWDAPDMNMWVAALDSEVQAARTPIVLVAHSLGCITVAHWVATHPDSAHRVAAALLVAPADIERPNAPKIFRTFNPIPLQPLPFSSVVVASTTDEWTHIDRAKVFATAWRSRLVNIGNAGHINATAGFGAWLEGELLLADLIREISRTD